jgi:hypothetical protein
MAWPCFSRGLMSNRVAWASGTMKAPLTPWKRAEDDHLGQ